MPLSSENAVVMFLEKKKRLNLTNTPRTKGDYPLLTVGVVVKNVETTVDECLNSLVNSDYAKSLLEIIVVDGKSTDNTLVVAKKILEKSGITFKIFSDEGKGLGYARQIVVDNAKGKYVCWIDGDNILPSRFLKNHVEFAEEHHNVSLFIPIILFKGKQRLSRLEGYCWLLPTLNSVGTHKTPHLAMQGTLTSLAALRQIGGFDTTITGAGEDTDLFNRMRAQGNVIMANPKARIFHVMRSSWKTLYKQISWWSKTQPRLSKSEAFKQVSLRIMTTFKQFPLILTYFRDPVGFFMPFYVVIWNGWYFIHSLRL